MARTKVSVLGLIISALVLAGLSSRVMANAIVDLHDPLRGITFYSAELSSDGLDELQTKPGRFSSKDVMTLGLSALMFDEEADPEEYILWLRHDGPARWLTDSAQPPLQIVTDNDSLSFMPLHVLRPGQGRAAGPFVEKLEFALSIEEFDAIAESGNVVIELSTLLGKVEKTLTRQELDALLEFRDAAVQRHASSRNKLALAP